MPLENVVSRDGPVSPRHGVKQGNAVGVFLKKNFFLIGVISVIILAKLAPWFGATGGPLKPDYTIKQFSVVIIFFCSGFTLATNSLITAVYQIKFHFFAQCFSFLFAPIFVNTLCALIYWVYPELR